MSWVSWSQETYFLSNIKQPDGDPLIMSIYLTRLLILVHIPHRVASTSNSTSCENRPDLLQRKRNQNIHKTFCLRPAQTVTGPHREDLTNLWERAAVLSELCEKNNGPNNNSQVGEPHILSSVTKSAAGSIWRGPLSPGWDWLKQTHKHNKLHLKLYVKSCCVKKCF